MFKLIDQISWPILIVVAIFLGLAPMHPEPHLWQKTKMLMDGTLQKPIDIFDFLLHGAPLILIIIKLLRTNKQ